MYTFIGRWRLLVGKNYFINMKNSYFKRYFRDKQNVLWGVGPQVANSYILGKVEPLEDNAKALLNIDLDKFIKNNNWVEEFI